MDVCNQVMEKMDYAPDLIRYTSGNAVSQGLTQQQARKRVFRPRVLIYIALLAVVTGLLAFSMLTRETLKMNIIRDRGLLGREVAGGLIENVYRLQLANTSEESVTLQLSVDGIANIQIKRADNGNDTFVLPAATTEQVPVVVQIPYDSGLSNGMHEIKIHAKATSESKRDSVTSDTSNFYIPK